MLVCSDPVIQHFLSPRKLYSGPGGSLTSDRIIISLKAIIVVCFCVVLHAEALHETYDEYEIAAHC